MVTRLVFSVLLCLFTSLSFAQNRLNIVFVLTDDLGYADLGTYGNPVIATPFLDSIAGAGIKATNFVVSTPSCTPSRASFFTGRYASRYNLPAPIAPGAQAGLPDNEVTIAEVLKKAGYKTAMIGKWHLGDKQPYHHPTAQGFDSYYGMLYSHDYRHPYVKTDTTIKIFRNRTPVINNPADSSLTLLYTKEAIAVIEKQTQQQPFFLYLAYNMPHLPVATAVRANKSEAEQRGGALGVVIEEMDSCLNLLWKTLARKKMLDNTIFIFSSDNGPWVAYPDRMAADSVTERWHAGSAGVFRGSKASSYEGGIRVPFILYWKNRFAPAVLRNPISNLDLLPTLVKLVKAQLPAGRTLDGQDISDLLLGKVNKEDYHHRPIYIVNNGKAEAVRMENWKYREAPATIDNVTGKKIEAVIELFNINQDPGERVNVITRYPQKAAELKKVFDAFPGLSEN